MIAFAFSLQILAAAALVLARPWPALDTLGKFFCGKLLHFYLNR
jgi:hypothetical protein